MTVFWTTIADPVLCLLYSLVSVLLHISRTRLEDGILNNLWNKHFLPEDAGVYLRTGRCLCSASDSIANSFDEKNWLHGLLGTTLHKIADQHVVRSVALQSRHCGSLWGMAQGEGNPQGVSNASKSTKSKVKTVKIDIWSDNLVKAWNSLLH